MRTIVRMKIIADTNTFLAVILYEPERDSIIRLTVGHDLVAPDILPFEMGNALTAMLKRGRLTPENLLSVWDAAQQIPVDLRSINVREALKTASQFSIYAYDAYFIDCAIRHKASLLTLDKKLQAVSNNLKIDTLEV